MYEFSFFFYLRFVLFFCFSIIIQLLDMKGIYFLSVYGSVLVFICLWSQFLGMLLVYK